MACFDKAEATVTSAFYLKGRGERRFVRVAAGRMKEVPPAGRKVTSRW